MPEESSTVDDAGDFENWGGRISSMKKLIEKSNAKQKEDAGKRTKFFEEKMDDINENMRDMMVRLDNMERDMKKTIEYSVKSVR